MLDVRCPEHLEAVRRFADRHGLRAALEGQLRVLADWPDAVCVLHSDPAPHSFYFVMVRPDRDGTARPVFNGGLIFYAGRESGAGAPQYSVTLSGRTDPRWEIHT